MDLQESSVKNLVTKVKQDLLASSQVDVYSLVPPSPYDTAWLSMVSNPQQSDQPLFQGCLDWVLQHQNRGGSWGENIAHPTIECLTSTLACICALTTWNVGHDAIQKGLAFIHANTEKLLEEQNGSFLEWFAIVFPAMIELAETKGLHVYFSNGSAALVEQVFLERQQIFKTQSWVAGCDQQQYYPARMLKYLEDGLIQSPSAIAYAFMKTGNKEFLVKLNSIVQTCGYGVPAVHPFDEDLVKILLINQIETLGLAEHFVEEITSLLGQVYRSYISCEEPKSMAKHALPLQLYTHSLAFRLLRLHGYRVSPQKFCRFLEDEDIVAYIEEHHEPFLSAMYNVYRATDVTFIRENQLKDARAFSRRILEKETIKDSTNLQEQVYFILFAKRREKYTRVLFDKILKTYEHRRCIERKETLGPWTGNALSYRLLSCQSNATLLQLAIENYTLRQSVFRNELKELERWSKDMGLADMGFARQKTTYCYFAVASTASNSSFSDVRLALVKGAILVTVADDFFDREGSMDELDALANAINRYNVMLNNDSKCVTTTLTVMRWEPKGLTGHGKTIFNALKDLVDDISGHFFNKNGYDIKAYLQDLWCQTIASWLKEAEWSRNGNAPSTVEYLQVATSSIASQTILLPAAFLLNPPPEIDILKCPQRQPLKNSLMLLTREEEEGKPNLVLLHMKENPNLGVEESIAIVQKTLDEKKKEFLELALSSNEMPEACKQLHLHCLKAFQMFFNSTNAFDSPTELLADINKAIFDPLRVEDVQGSFMPLNSMQGILGLKKDKSLAIHGKSHYSSSKPCNGIFESTCAIKVQGNSRKDLVTKPYCRILSVKMRNPIIYTTFSKPKAYI
ncbi:S-linalool synthase-like [Prunus yedoensis var. nudiflora]|uniref:S-linalool synthase-like n=1 Tax=Prunus yedoensis var. nudiflora TaxID=2094558 RepID=A0A314YGG9_PRUYE|nr:S-linalool synthase-like [Prunus yedoensis var. nudiflora]